MKKGLRNLNFKKAKQNCDSSIKIMNFISQNVCIYTAYKVRSFYSILAEIKKRVKKSVGDHNRKRVIF